MNQSIKHRGPDDEGIHYCKKNNLTLGHVRLSIIDISNAGHQPMFYSKKKGASSKKYNKQNIINSDISITYNGEIYNYLDIKKELEELGYYFSTKTDTEIILASYKEWGENCVNKFNGMWAFCIHNIKNKTIFLSRDRLGVKPLYYYLKKGKFIFSSEIKGLIKHENENINSRKNISKESTDYFFSLGFIPSPYTIYNNVFKLESRQNLIMDLSNNKVIKKYYYYNIPKYKPLFNYNKLIEEGNKILENSIKIRIKADVHVGAFLSGGIDSSSIVSKMTKHINSNKLHTFSIGFREKKYDETYFINIIKEYCKTKHHHTYFEKSDFKKALISYQKIYDEPFGDFGFLPQFINSKETKKIVKITLTGDGGDEIFGGYQTYKRGIIFGIGRRIPKIIRKILLKTINIFKKDYDYSILGKIRELLKWLEYPKNELMINLNKKNNFFGNESKIFYKNRMDECIKLSNGNLGEAQRTYDLFYGRMSDNYLTKTDRTTMLYSIEARSPYLDYRFIELTSKIPFNYKYNIFGNTKIILKKMLKNIIPYEIINRTKKGFTPPFIDYLENNKEEVYKEISELKGIIKNKEVNNHLINVIKNKNFKMDSDFILKAYLYKIWYKKWIKNS